MNQIIEINVSTPEQFIRAVRLSQNVFENQTVINVINRGESFARASELTSDIQYGVTSLYKNTVGSFAGAQLSLFGSLVITACLDNVGWQLFYNFIIIAAIFCFISLAVGIESTQRFIAFGGIIGISYAVIQLYYRIGSEISIGRRIGEAILFALEPVLLTVLGVHFILGGSIETAHIWNVFLIAIQAPTVWGWCLMAAETVLVIVLIWLTVWIGRLGFEQKLAAMLLTIIILFIYLMQILSVMGIFEMRIYAPIGYVPQSSVIFLMLYLRLITGKIFRR